MSAGTVHVAVREFIGSSLPHIGNLHAEVQGDTCKRVVAVEDHVTIGHFHHAPNAVVWRLELHSLFHGLATELVQWHALHQARVDLAVSLGCFHFNLHVIACFGTFQTLFQARHDHTTTMDVCKGFFTSAGIQQLTVAVVEGIMERNDGVLLDLHDC